ncbi:recombinase family protein [Sphingopyxis sp. J-6]|uniref:recombinase family protein n=1 Tax=Sphingopyxis sp. J-6 TaxID=3122054 RepID=UPI003984342A
MRLPAKEPRFVRTAIYARFSTTLQDLRSIEDQVRICMERAEREGWTISGIFTDPAISGAVRDRPGLNQLLEHVKTGQTDQVLAEALDRLSRHQGDMAWLFDHVRHAGARIFTLSEGDVGELHIGMVGAQASMFRKNNADKIRRGLSGRVAEGRAAGNIVYGYRKVHELDAKGEPIRGLREIDPDQAVVVRRIYDEYLADDSPLTIARRVNAEGVPSPAGGEWSVSAINGDAKRGNGILCNEIYAGVMIYNRTTMSRDPDTRRRVTRLNPFDQWQRQPVPDLAIVDRESWDRVQARKAGTKGLPIVRLKRPRKLLSGIVRCGVCGGSMVIRDSSMWGCATARTKGTCATKRKVDNAKLERRVIAGLRKDLLSADMVDAAVAAYMRMRKQLAREAADLDRRQTSRLADLDKQIANLVTAVAGGGDIPELVDALRNARAERAAIDGDRRERDAENMIILAPAIAKAYRKAIDNLSDLLKNHEREHASAQRTLRALIDHVIVTPASTPRGVDIELVGRLENVVALATGAPANVERTDFPLKMVAEEGLEPPTRGL